MFNYDNLSFLVTAEGLNMIGYQNEHIKVIGFHESKGQRKIWNCICLTCNKEVLRNTNEIKKGIPKKCRDCFLKLMGTYHKTGGRKIKYSSHSVKNRSLFDTWKLILRRCFDVKDKNYKYYGLKGINICNEWKSDFLNFYNWALTNGWQKGLTIDRIDNDGNYEPINCRFITRSENSKKGNKKIDL